MTLVYLMTSCSNGKLDEKGFQVSSSSDNTKDEQANELNSDSLKIDTRPSSVLLTGLSNIRLTTIYKVNLNNRNTGITI